MSSLPRSVPNDLQIGVSSPTISTCARPNLRVGGVGADVDVHRIEQHHAAQGRDVGLLREQHPANIRELDDRGVLAGCADRETLAAHERVIAGILVGTFAEGQALGSHGEPGTVHHHEHDAHAEVLFADQVAGSAVILHDAGRRAVDTQLVLDRQARDGVAIAQ